MTPSPFPRDKANIMNMNPSGRRSPIGCLFCIVVIVLGLVFFQRYLDRAGERRVIPDIVARISPGTGAGLADGIAVAVALDVSPSMADAVATKDGQAEPKIAIAKRVVVKAFQDIAEFADGVSNSTTVVAGLWAFSGNVLRVRPLSRPDKDSIQSEVDALHESGGTAIGEALIEAKIGLNEAGLARQYVILVTDGQSNMGPGPETVLEAYRRLPAPHQPSVYIVAFDITADLFSPLKNLGATVVEARDAKELQTAIDRIIYGDILVEKPD